MSNDVDINKIAKAVENLTHRVNEQAKAVGGKISDAAGNGKEKIGQLKNTVEENPLLSVGIAAAVGWILGRLLKRNNKD